MTETVVCAGAVVLDSERVLLVRQSTGHSLEGLWTIPWGQLDPGESPSAAAIRETAEEGGVVVEVEGLLGVQELPEPWLGMIGLLYLCRHVSGDPTPDHRETDAARFFHAEELGEIRDALEPLTNWLITRVFAGEYSVLRSQASNPYVPSLGFV
ncbi:MAG: NUDIX hydrolase [Woeseiaceae bacterium]|nr:NUDIX hydrolase [Woeseiaceae bacterium]